MRAPDPAQYDDFAAGYEAHAEVAPYNAHYDRPATLALLGDVAGRVILDAACGPGLYAEELLARGATVRGFDGSASMIERARARLGPDADLWVQSLDAPITPVAEASIDIVLCALAYHYSNDRPSFLAEAARVLRPGGAVVISTQHPTTDWLRLGGSYFDTRPVSEVWSKGWEVTTWVTPLTQLTEEFAAAGFLIERLIEPQPAAAMAEAYPETFTRLSTEPGFILFRLRRAEP